MRPSRFILFALSFLYLFASCHLHLEYLDDGAATYGAWRVLQGAVPYRDFMVITTPAYFYTLAALLKVFGPHLMVERVWQCLVWSGLFLTLYSIGRLVLPAFFCWVAWLMALVLIGRFPHVAGAMPSALLLSFLSVYFCLRTLPRLRREGLIVSGVCAGLCALFRQDIGFYTALAVFSTLALCHDAGLRKRGDQRRFIFGVFLAVLIPAAYFLTQAPFQRIYFGLVEYPFKVYPSYSFIPYPALTRNLELFLGRQITLGQFLAMSEQTFFYYFIPSVLIFSILFLTAGWHRPKDGRPAVLLWPMALLTLLGVLFLSQARFRADPAHLLPAYLAACLLFAFLLYCVHQRKKTLYLIPAGLVIAAFLAPGLSSKISFLTTPGASARLSLPRAAGIDVTGRNAGETDEFSNYERAIRYAQEITRPGEKIFVGSTRHDRVCYADPMFYFLSERDSATRHHEMHRGAVVTQSAQAEIIGELEENDVRVVVKRRLLDDQCGEPNESVRTTGSRSLDEYLGEHYALDRQFGGNQVWVRLDKQR